MLNKYLTFLLPLVILLSIACTGEQAKNKKRTKKLTGNEAIKIAEEYIKKEGFTKVKVDLKKYKITFEPGEFATDTNDILTNRYNTIKAKAIGARTYGDDNEKWAVGFSLIPYENNNARCVTMDSLGNQVTLQSQNVTESWIFAKAD